MKIEKPTPFKKNLKRRHCTNSRNHSLGADKFPKKCTKCQTIFTLIHLLIDCPSLELRRRDIKKVHAIQKLHLTLKNLTDPEMLAENTLKFMKNTSYISKC